MTPLNDLHFQNENYFIATTQYCFRIIASVIKLGLCSHTIISIYTFFKIVLFGACCHGSSKVFIVDYEK